MAKRAVYFFCTQSPDPAAVHVAPIVWDVLKAEGKLNESAGFQFDGLEVMKHTDARGDQFYFVPTRTSLCLDYPRYLPEMNQRFSDFDVSGMVTWHAGANAPANVLTVHSLGDVNSGVFGAAKPRLMRNLLKAFDRHRAELGLEGYHVSTEATHWSGVHDGHGDPSLLTRFPVTMMDVEVGSDESSWSDPVPCTALARALTEVFEDDGKKVHNLLCIGGVHFEPSFAEAALTEWGDGAFGVTHILANQWLESGHYEDESGAERAAAAAEAIEGGISAVVMHDKLKGCYKDLARKLGARFGVPVCKHQKLRTPLEMELAD